MVLDNRGETGNTAEVELVNAQGATCRVSFPVEIYVDCAGVSCSITAPDTMSPFLNQSDDSSMDPGFQGLFEVSSDGSGADLDQEVLLVVDGDETNAFGVLPVMMGENAVATFSGVELSEGSHRVQSICTDTNGNRTRSGVAEWIVDTVPCSATVSTPAADQVFNDTDDIDPMIDGVQVAASGTVAGDSCTAVALGICGAEGSPATLTEQDWSGQLTLGTTPMQDICASVTDEAGNVGEGRVSVRVRTDAPVLEIAVPATGTSFNSEGTSGRTADLDSSTPACDAVFRVNCSEVGVEVTLLEEGSGSTLVGGTATCEAMAGLPMPFAGVATFPAVELPSLNDGSTTNVIARQENDRLVGLSTPVALTPDCEAPNFNVLAPTCGSLLRPASDDLDPSTPEFEYRVRVLSGSVPRPAVELQISDAMTGAPVGALQRSDLPATGPIIEFYPAGSSPSGATFGSGGMLELEACGEDAAGNRGCAPTCPVTVADLPIVTLVTPLSGQVITAADDCDSVAPGLQVRVTANTDAVDGSVARISIGASELSTIVVAGAASGCLSAVDGRGITVTASVTDPSRGVSSDSATIDIDTVAPDTALDLATPVAMANVRAGTARFEWTAVDDGGFSLSSYELRCSNRIISDESRWADATPYTLSAVPAAGGVSESELVPGFRLGTSLNCSLRGRDVAGNLTPIGTNAVLNNDPRSATATLSGGGGESVSVMGVGDVNGDTFDDVLVTGDVGSSAAYIYLGSATGVGAAPSVTFTLPSAASIGHRGIGLGDFNRDGRSDFAISAPSDTGFTGRVWVMFGRAASSAWPSSINLTSGCGADMCLASSTPLAVFGSGMGAVDFDGDSIMDLAIGAPGISTAGHVYVIRGSASHVSGSNFLVPATSPDGFDISGPAVGAFGQSLTSIGDVGVDSRHELVIGAAGSVSMVLGRSYTAASGLQAVPSSAVSTIASGAPTFGETVRAVGDFNGDSRIDIGVRDASNEGSISLYYQQVGGSFASTAVVIENDLGRPSGNYYGSSIGLGYHPWSGTLGDVDGDMRADVLAGSDERNEVGTDPRAPGACEVVYGSSNSGYDPSRLVDTGFDFQPSGTPGNRRVAAFVGDLNGDGYSDIFCADSLGGQAYAVY